MMAYEFSPTSVSPEHIKKYAQLLSFVFKETNKFTPEFLDWQYAKNPQGQVVGYDAYANNELAAHYVTIPVVYTINGIATKGLLSLNTATHPHHQGKGLFTQLANKTYTLGKELGYQFIIGVANQNSTPGFLKKLGFYLISSLDVKIGLGKIHTRTHQHYQLQSFWNKESMSWRLANPAANYLRSGECIYTNTNKLSIHALMCTLKPDMNNIIPPSKKLIPFKTWIGIDAKKEFKGLYFKLPEKLKPSPLNLIFKDLTGQFPIFNKDHVRFDLIDFDAY